MKIVQHTATDTITLSIEKGKLCVKSKQAKFKCKFDVSMVYDLLADSMSINDPDPGISRRAKQMSQYHETSIAPGPFVNRQSPVINK
jgi:hypothetical protein